MRKCYTGVSQEKKIKGLEKMRKNEIMSKAINQYILDNDFLMRFIKDNVNEKIYDSREYHDSMILDVIENDLNNSYSQGYITDYILDEIDTYELVDAIHERYKEDFYEIAEQCNKRYY